MPTCLGCIIILRLSLRVQYSGFLADSSAFVTAMLNIVDVQASIIPLMTMNSDMFEILSYLQQQLVDLNCKLYCLLSISLYLSHLCPEYSLLCSNWEILLDLNCITSLYYIVPLPRSILVVHFNIVIPI
ncbi:hypothetical protein MTR67_019706 [Solanum verrucosum]|uniref:Uncharacterized protein n=1 Tax=Solanum verrucosum TaxID=315347 RepID=A0AAF0QTD4_SOLVR|nr:hypothetical protein MTR67_019706 [Solanum verrucosum]